MSSGNLSSGSFSAENAPGALPYVTRARTHGASSVSLLAAVFCTVAFNVSFWRGLAGLTSTSSDDLRLVAACGIALTALFYVIFVLLSFRAVFKPALMLIFVVAALTASFMDAYNIVIDDGMIQNVLETDRSEVADLLTPRFWIYLSLLGVVPAILLGLTRTHYPRGRAGLRTRALAVLIGACVITTSVGLSYKGFVMLGREHKDLRMRINPLYPIYSTIEALLQREHRAQQISKIGEDAHRDTWVSTELRRALIFVVGETARAKSFSLNGYARDTNPELQHLEVINFSDAHACGTSTSISVRCMFSLLRQGEFDRSEADAQENVLDVLARAGVEVWWRDNNSGCKHVCDRVSTESFDPRATSSLCENGECVDEVLLDGLAERLSRTSGDVLIVLHQRGSHGPTYSKRTPYRFKQFRPECTGSGVHRCERSSIVNAYDNTILYTDYILARIIHILESQSQAVAAGLIYVSDHGESLGEHGIYLHGLPNLIAPSEQTRIPFLMWLSPELKAQLQLDATCLRERIREPVSHDHVSASLLGLFDVRTRVYDRSLDVLDACRRRAPAAPAWVLRGPSS